MTNDYSDLRLLTGFISAALMAWKLTVINVMAIAPVPDNANIHQVIGDLYWY
jgi:hypothetical protein